ncbi:phosphoglucosamine mutase GlmM [methanogenic archaeon mixed culture ISO4-G1]|nr:phosphoglucosamine mutase GlmM [methanogenic archaeon mixed culture ISO4-G1]
MKMFGTNGIRGVANGYLNCELSLKVGKAIATVLGPGPIAIAMDTRISSPMVLSAVSAGLMSMGVDVIDLGMVPTPALQYYVKCRKEVTAGVMITASHNPPEFNGIKCVAGDGTECSHEAESAIEDAYERDLEVVGWKDIGTMTRYDKAGEEYVDAVVAKVDVETIKKAKIKVCLDCANGASVYTSPMLMRKLGVEAVVLNGEPDGMFPGHYSEPVEENLTELKEVIVKEKADLGIAHDGDADRCVFVSNTGKYLPGDIGLALLSILSMRSASKKQMVSTVALSNMVEDAVKNEGGETIRTAVGSPIVARRMIETGAPIGGEDNGGIIFADHQYCRDGAMAAARMIEFVARNGPIQDQVDRLPKYYTFKSAAPCADDKKEKLIECMASNHSNERMDRTDGLKIFFDDGWVLLRPSGTEPKFRIYSESKDESVAKSRSEEFVREVADILRKI